jgi:hypothetical protein
MGLSRNLNIIFSMFCSEEVYTITKGHSLPISHTLAPLPKLLIVIVEICELERDVREISLRCQLPRRVLIAHTTRAELTRSLLVPFIPSGANLNQYPLIWGLNNRRPNN